MAFIDDLKELIKKYDTETVEENEDSETVEEKEKTETVEENEDSDTVETVNGNEDSETVYTEQHKMVVKNVDGKRVEEEKTIRVDERGEYYYV